ncbi:MAG: DUF4250 domain-containing protein [Anaeroplasmataceae bacterium]|nr:DUF4250 domain-containing protein [Anaeroplasmataceae bacterium]
MLPREPHLLLSIVNLKLRDCYPSLEQLCDDLDDNKEEIEALLGQIGYVYQACVNQFKPRSE